MQVVFCTVEASLPLQAQRLVVTVNHVTRIVPDACHGGEMIPSRDAVETNPRRTACLGKAPLSTRQHQLLGVLESAGASAMIHFTLVGRSLFFNSPAFLPQLGQGFKSTTFP